MSIIRHREEVPVAKMKMFGGAGEAEHHKILLGADEMYGKGRLFNHVVLNPGCETGWHVHHGDGATFYILKGQGEYDDNGESVVVGPGDVCFVDAEQSHAMRCLGDEPLEFIALVLFK